MILNNLTPRGTLHGQIFRGGGGGTSDYDELSNRPSINTHIVTGSKNGHDYDLANLDDVLIKELNPNITPGVNYPRLEHIKDKDDNIYIVKYPAFTGAISGLVPQVVNPSGKVLNDSGNWSVLPTAIDYSLTEQNTGIKWIDGEDIYSITINLNGINASPNDWTNLHYEPNVKTMIKSESSGINSGTNTYYTTPYIRINYDRNTKYFNYYITDMPTSTTMNIYITLFYTKTT